MNRERIEEVAGRALRTALQDRAVEAIKVREDEDWSGEPSLYIDVVLASGSNAVDGDLSIRLRRELSNELLAAGERRFPYLRVRSREDEVLDDEPGLH